MKGKFLEIAGRAVGDGEPCFIIAEAGVNHNGDLSRALELVDAAVDAKADAVKFQTFQASRLVTPLARQAEYQRRNTGKSESQFEMLKRLELSLEDHECLLAHCVRRGITFLSTPFDHQSVDLLAGLGVAAYKIGSGDITNPPLLKHVASKQRPIILSTGMCNLSDVEMAVELLEGEGADFAILHCVSNYPAAASDTNLRALMTLATAFGVPVGYSDHTDGDCIALASVAMGACIVEKHFTLDRTLPGPDHQASLEPGELATMVRGIRTVEQAMGTGRKRPAVSEANTAEVARKSLVAEVDIEPGSLLTEEVIAIKRPGTGLPPSMRALILNRTACSRIAAGELIRLENVA